MEDYQETSIISVQLSDEFDDETESNDEIEKRKKIVSEKFSFPLQWGFIKPYFTCVGVQEDIHNPRKTKFTGKCKKCNGKVIAEMSSLSSK